MNPLEYLVKRALTEKGVARVEEALKRSLERGDTQSAHRLIGILTRHEFRGKPGISGRPMSSPKAMRVFNPKQKMKENLSKGRVALEFAEKGSPSKPWVGPLPEGVARKRVEMGIGLRPELVTAGKSWRPLELGWLQSYGEGEGRHMLAYKRLQDRMDRINRGMKTPVFTTLEPGRGMENPAGKGKGTVDAQKMWAEQKPRLGGMTHVIHPSTEGPNKALLEAMVPEGLKGRTGKVVELGPYGSPLRKELAQAPVTATRGTGEGSTSLRFVRDIENRIFKGQPAAPSQLDVALSEAVERGRQGQGSGLASQLPASVRSRVEQVASGRTGMPQEAVDTARRILRNEPISQVDADIVRVAERAAKGQAPTKAELASIKLRSQLQRMKPYLKKRYVIPAAAAAILGASLPLVLGGRGGEEQRKAASVPPYLLKRALGA